ncbi:MAG: hypothetical protein ACLU85_05030 [Lachnospirales bacterium]
MRPDESKMQTMPAVRGLSAREFISGDIGYKNTSMNKSRKFIISPP